VSCQALLGGRQRCAEALHAGLQVLGHPRHDGDDELLAGAVQAGGRLAEALLERARPRLRRVEPRLLSRPPVLPAG
jgi:hypothetical protein